MVQLIDKDAVMAEIEKYISNYKGILNEIDKSSDKWVTSTLMLESKIDVLQHILSFLGTLKVKEVDLEKEINNYISDNFFGSQTMGFFANRTKEEPNHQDIALCAKYFFELGLKAVQKGE